ncbi:MAG: DUF4293 domain-containing protein [Prevotella sp.]
MLQRKQTVFLSLAFILTLVCMCLPLGSFEPNGMGVDSQMYNLWIVNNGKHDYTVAGLFLVLLVSCPLNLTAIMSFKNRIYQSRLCLMNIFLQIAWYVVYVISVKLAGHSDATYHVAVASCFPLISLILYIMARKAILADEKLVRAADRIR